MASHLELKPDDKHFFKTILKWASLSVVSLVSLATYASKLRKTYSSPSFLNNKRAPPPLKDLVPLIFNDEKTDHTFGPYLLISPSHLTKTPSPPIEIPKLTEYPFTLPTISSILSYTNQYNLTTNDKSSKILKLWKTTKVYHPNGTTWQSFMRPDNQSYIRIPDHTNLPPKWKTDVLIADTPTHRIILYLKIWDKYLNNFADYDRLISHMPLFPADPETHVMSPHDDNLPVLFSLATI
ncbi:MAG: hypothetical protein Hyperionvirus14_5 [Hyperionvirus sp.]|uniref:Uncharacterized protein n=1 Tax=Hyperionvirus sp. TaxID=2487770 RepID=A0A3G5A9G1_9VIRU|nr:MAG: hypothetical protein Hyperionvirus14_5 [Hyperionvirus sp.]